MNLNQLMNLNQKKKANKLKKSPKQLKTKYEAKCTYCYKTFKHKNSYEKHTIEQTCYKSNEITYCNVCLYTYETHLQYKNHLFSMEHLNNIGFNNIERLKTKEVSQIHLADPYLNNNDINKIAKTNLGDSFTFIYNTGNTQTISLLSSNNNIKPLLNIIPEDVIIQESQELNKLSKSTQPQPISQPISQPTIRQNKIISFLEKQTSIEESGKMFYKMLDNKLQLEDYKGLQNMITYINIDNAFKENYIKVIESFISLLVKQSTSGIKSYKEKNISQLVINLTS